MKKLGNTNKLMKCSVLDKVRSSGSTRRSSWTTQHGSARWFIDHATSYFFISIRNCPWERERGMHHRWTCLYFYTYNAKYILRLCFNSMTDVCKYVLALRVLNTYLRSRACVLPYLSMLRHAVSLRDDVGEFLIQNNRHWTPLKQSYAPQIDASSCHWASVHW